MLSIPPFLWKRRILRGGGDELNFMTDEHRFVHHYDKVESIFDDLEKHMTFIFRNDKGMAVWAYPVTVKKTPHHLTFSSIDELQCTHAYVFKMTNVK